MPQHKKKRTSDSDTSDSGPDDVAPPKKSKVEKAKANSSSKDDDEPSWAIDKKRFVKVREFKGKLMIDIREYYESDGDLKPGKKGIALSAIQWRKLVDVIPEIEAAIKEKA